MHRATRKEPPVLPSCLSMVIGHIVALCLAQWLASAWARPPSFASGVMEVTRPALAQAGSCLASLSS